MATETLTTQCCIAGGGPAGMMLGFLLARAGVDVDGAGEARRLLARFPRRHGSSLDARADVRAWPAGRFSQTAASEAEHLGAQIGDTAFTLADFTRLPTHCKFIALMPQWDFLELPGRQGERYRDFHLMMKTRGDRSHRRGRPHRRRARAAGRRRGRDPCRPGGRQRRPPFHVRERAGFAVEDFGAPMDVLWMRLSRQPGDRVPRLSAMSTPAAS